MDEIAKYNQARWDDLVAANVEFSRPFLNLDEAAARHVVDRQGVLGQVAGKKVLCLASGGGQQSVAFALLWAQVTVFDLSPAQLQRDRAAAAHYKFDIDIVQGDMRDLSCFADQQFDIVWQAFSINFVPDVRPVFREVARVLKPGGPYRLEYYNPFTSAADDASWDERGYRLTAPYHDGADMSELFPTWDVYDDEGHKQVIQGPKEFRHRLSTVLNSLIEQGFILRHVWEDTGKNPQAEPGTWDHFMAFTAPFLTFWFHYRPGL
jgi:SAM-dependent methyltransferase